MKAGFVLVFLWLLWAASIFLDRPDQDNSDVSESVKTCRIFQMTLSTRERMRTEGEEPGNDDFSAAGKACKGLEEAIATSNPKKIQDAAKTLRPILSLLGLSPSTPREQLVALEEKTSGFKGEQLFYSLADLAKRALNASEPEKAEHYAKQ